MATSNGPGLRTDTLTWHLPAGDASVWMGDVPHPETWSDLFDGLEPRLAVVALTRHASIHPGPACEQHRQRLTGSNSLHSKTFREPRTLEPLPMGYISCRL